MANEKQINQTEKVYYRKPRAKGYVGVSTPAGSHVLYNAELSIVNGVKKAQPGQRIDWFRYIQASEKSCDLTSIVARYLSGDMSVVNVNPSPIYGDIAAMPKNVNEVQDLADRSKAGFDKLSDEIKSIFNNSFEEFYNSVLAGTTEQKISAYAKAKVEAAAKLEEGGQNDGK